MSPPRVLPGFIRGVIVLMLLAGLAGTPCASETFGPPAAPFICQPVPHQPDAFLCYIQPANTDTQWYLSHQNELYRVSSIGPDADMSDFGFSPSGKFLQVSSYGEGHPLLQVYATHELLETYAAEPLGGWGGYPGWVSFAGWDGDALLIESNVPLHEDYDTSADYPEDESAIFRWRADQQGLEFVQKQPVDPDALRTGPFPVIYFAYDQYAINPEAEDKLLNLSLLFKERPEINVQIEGHTDERGTDDYNLALGERLADSVKAYLVKLGVAPERMTIKSYSESRPINPGHDEAAWAQNRRVEFMYAE